VPRTVTVFTAPLRFAHPGLAGSQPRRAAYLSGSDNAAAPLLALANLAAAFAWLDT
jgi:poly(3-hydroxyalkanoate) synthetase